MRRSILSAALAALLGAGLAGVPARAAGDGTEAEAERSAVRELLEGASGRHEVWGAVPELVVLTSVMNYTRTDATAGFRATDEQLSAAETAAFRADLESALHELTGGMVRGFARVREEASMAGQVVAVFRRGQIVAGRFQGIHEATGSLGYGGRTTKAGVITAGAVFVDRDFDRRSEQRALLRAHELGHALGYNHVESRRSVMNPRVGSEITDFDRRAIRLAFPAPLGAVAATAALQHPSQN